MTHLFPQKLERRSPCTRSGVATVEFAVCLPIIIVLLVGSIEASNAIFLRQTLTFVAYESAQIASAIGGTESSAATRGYEILSSYDVKDAAITITPSITATTIPRTRISVKVTAPANANTIGFDWFFRNKTLEKSVTMSRL